MLDGRTGGGVKDEGEVYGSDSDEVWGIEEAEFGTVGVVDDEPRETEGVRLRRKRGGNRVDKTDHAVWSAPSCNSSLPWPVPQYRGPSTSSASASPASASGMRPAPSLPQRVIRVR